jgi:hypothetical protein
MVTSTVSGSPRLSLAGLSEPGRAWEIRLVANRRGLPADVAEYLRAAADRLDAPGTRIDDVEKLDTIVLDPDATFSHLVLLGRDAVVYTAHPEPDSEQVRVVRHPSLSEATSTDPDLVLPLSCVSHELEQANFPMTVIAAPAAFYRRHETEMR